MEPIADFIVEISDQLDLPDNGYKTIWIPTQPMLQKMQKYLRKFRNLFIFTNTLSLQVEALWKCDSFTMITVLQ